MASSAFSLFIHQNSKGRLACPHCHDFDLQIVSSRIEAAGAERVVSKKRKTTPILQGGKESSVVLECFCRGCSTIPVDEEGGVDVVFHVLRLTHQDGIMVLKWDALEK
jgi:hypothetical protein